MRAKIGFDWANWMYVNGRRVRQVSDAECFRIGQLLGWYANPERWIKCGTYS